MLSHAEWVGRAGVRGGGGLMGEKSLVHVNPTKIVAFGFNHVELAMSGVFGYVSIVCFS